VNRFLVVGCDTFRYMWPPVVTKQLRQGRNNP
jgi:hypothetical protein